MIRNSIVALSLLWAVPSEAAFIQTTAPVDLDGLYTEEDVICDPCGLASISYSYDDVTAAVGDYNVSWWGSGGMAHDAAGEAIDIYKDEAAGNWGVNSLWRADLGDQILFDSIEFFGDGTGEWFTTSSWGYGFIADFTVVALAAGGSGPPPSRVPEPGSLALLAGGVIVSLLRFKRDAGPALR